MVFWLETELKKTLSRIIFFQEKGFGWNIYFMALRKSRNH